MLKTHDAVVAALEKLGASPVREWVHVDLPIAVRSSTDFAAAIGRPVEEILKTLILADQQADELARRIDPASYLCAVCLPSTSKIDMKLIASLCGWRRAEMARKEEVADLFGYPPNGVSPFGLHPLSVWVDPLIYAHPTVIVGGGKAGVEIEIRTQVLKQFTKGLPTSEELI